MVDNSVCSQYLGTGHCPKNPLATVRGVKVFNFPIQSTCMVNCRLTKLNSNQYYNSSVPYYLDLMGDLENDTLVQTFLVNAQYHPTMTINTGEWHRLRIVNTNMGYLIWQMLDTIDVDYAGTQASISSNICQLWMISTDGIYFSSGPRLITQTPYNGTIVIPPGGRADLEIICFKSGNYSVIASNETGNGYFENAAVPLEKSLILFINVEGDDFSDEDSDKYGGYTQCNDWENDELNKNGQLVCEPLSYDYSPYLKDTRNLSYPNVTGLCRQGGYSTDTMDQCSSVLQRAVANQFGTQVAFNGKIFSDTKAIFTVPHNTTFEFLITSNFHPFHQHTWPFQIQRNIVGGWLGQQVLCFQFSCTVHVLNFVGSWVDSANVLCGCFHGQRGVIFE